MQATLTEREQLAADKEAEAQGLQRHLAQLLGMPQADVPLLHRARFGAQGSNSSGADQAAASRIAALEVRMAAGRQRGRHRWWKHPLCVCTQLHPAFS